MENKLFRNEHNKIIAGVSSGLADHIWVDVALIRILFVLSAIFFAGIGLIVYIVMWIILPSKNDPTAKFSKFNDYFQNNPGYCEMFNSSKTTDSQQNSDAKTNWDTENAHLGQKPDFTPFNEFNQKSKTFIGFVLLVLGFYFFLLQMGWLSWDYFYIFFVYKLWPLVIIAVGLVLIFKNKQKTEGKNFDNKNSQQSTKQTVAEDLSDAEEQKNEN